MRNYFTYTFILFATYIAGFSVGFSQITPLDRDTLNYTQIQFSVPKQKGAVKYEFSMMHGSNLERNYSSENDQITLSDFTFGETITWHYSAISAEEKVLFSSNSFSFHIRKDQWVDSNYFRYILLNSIVATTSSENYFLLDMSRVMIDRTGKPVWFLPVTSDFSKDAQVRDLRETPEGNFTFICDSLAFETDKKGKILWKSQDEIELSKGKKVKVSFHHELEKLPNGNYLTLGRRIESRTDPLTGEVYQYPVSYILELDQRNKVVWYWDANTYFTDAEFFDGKEKSQISLLTHMNAASLSGKFVYCGFRDVNRVIKIEKSSGNVVATYGDAPATDKNFGGNGFFKRQHDVTILSNGNIAVFNNNLIQLDSVFSSVVVFSDQGKKSAIVYQIPLPIDFLSNGKSFNFGNVDELQNKNLLVCWGALSRVSEFNSTGTVLWDLFTLRYNDLKNDWIPFANYRVHSCTGL